MTSLKCKSTASARMISVTTTTGAVAEVAATRATAVAEDKATVEVDVVREMATVADPRTIVVRVACRTARTARQ